MSILNYLKHPLAKNIENLDHNNTYEIHRNIIISKPFLLKVYKRFYTYIFEFFGTDKDIKNLKIVEIGAGGFNSNYYNSNILTTDLLQTPFINQVEDAQNMSFQDSTLDGIIMIDVLHHIPKPDLFFKEVNRCLKKNGKLIMIEPYYSPWASLIYKNLHHEPWYDIESWDIPKTSGGRLSDANMKMPHNIFIRDLDIFKEKHKTLRVREIRRINFFYYLISGGLSYKSLLPSIFCPLIFFLERLLSPLAPLLAMHMIISIEKD